MEVRERVHCARRQADNAQQAAFLARMLMGKGGIIGCEAPRHPFPAMHTAVRAGLLETARHLDLMVLRWGR